MRCVFFTHYISLVLMNEANTDTVLIFTLQDVGLPPQPPAPHPTSKRAELSASFVVLHLCSTLIHHQHTHTLTPGPTYIHIYIYTSSWQIATTPFVVLGVNLIQGESHSTYEWGSFGELIPSIFLQFLILSLFRLKEKCKNLTKYERS